MHRPLISVSSTQGLWKFSQHSEAEEQVYFVFKFPFKVNNSFDLNHTSFNFNLNVFYCLDNGKILVFPLQFMILYDYRAHTEVFVAWL